MTGIFGFLRDVFRAFGRMEIDDGVLGAWTNDRTLVHGRQESCCPVLGAIGGEATMVWQSNKGGQVVVHATEPITDPGSHSGESWTIKPSRLQVGGLTVNARLADQIMDERDVIDNGT